jgi:pimeloyl-ACP methyl ester carboxylesterase
MMKRSLLCLLVLLPLLSGLMVTLPSVASPAPSSCINPNGTNLLEGTLGGANYTIALLSNWKGTLVLYSHGYLFPNQPLLNPALDVRNPVVEALLQQGYALAGSSYSQNGWAVHQAFHDQIALLDFFDATCGHPSRTIAAGNSLGGIVTAGLVQLYPDLFAGAFPQCGPLAGSVGNWNQGLDGAFAFNVLLAGSSLSIVHLTDPTGTFNQAEGMLAAAQQTAAGRARIALTAALADLPGWFDPASPEPASQDVTAQEQNQFLREQQLDLAFLFLGRAELEARAGGNPSWNTGVNYSQQLERSADHDEVQALYQQAGLSLESDLSTLAAAPRIQADPGAVQYLSNSIIFNGQVRIPILTLHTTGDG